MANPDWAAGSWNRTEAVRTVREWRERLHLNGPSHYPRGAGLFVAGSPTSEIFLITEGIAGLSYMLPEGSEAFFSLAYPGHLINICAREPSLITATALTCCQAYQINMDGLLSAQCGDPGIAVLVERSLQNQLSRRTAALAQLLTLSSAERLECLLRELAAVLARHDGSNLPLPLKDDQMAMLLGLSARQFKRVKRTSHENGRPCLQAHRPFAPTRS